MLHTAEYNVLMYSRWRNQRWFILQLHFHRLLARTRIAQWFILVGTTQHSALCSFYTRQVLQVNHRMSNTIGILFLNYFEDITAVQ